MSKIEQGSAPGRWLSFHSLRGRFLVALLITGLLPVLLLGSYSFRAERRRAVALELSQLSDHSQRLAVFIDKDLASKATMVHHLALTSEFTSFLAGPQTELRRKAMNAWLQAQCAFDPDLDAILLCRPDGLCVTSSEPLYIGGNYAFRSYFKDAMAGRSRFTDLQIGMRKPEPFVGIAKAVISQGSIQGVILLRIKMARIQREVAARSAEGKIAYLVNPDGIVLAHTNQDLLYSAITPIPSGRLREIEASRQFMGRSIPVDVKLSPEGIQATFRVMASGNPEVLRYTNAGVSRWVAFRRLEEEPWAVGVAVNEREILRQSNRILLLTSLVCLLALVLVFLGGFWFSRKVLWPMERLRQAMETFGQGDPGVRAPESGHDEIACLGDRFNRMADTIEAQTRALEERVNTLEGILPICSSCRKIRDEKGVYLSLESYLSTRTNAQFSHGLCEECARKLYPDIFPAG